MTLLFSLLLFFLPAEGQTKLKVLTTVTDLSSLVQEIGGKHVEVDSLARGTQDPHYLAAKPSYMSKANKADLLIAIGHDLEVGYLPLIIQGARNPKISRHSSGFMEVAKLVTPLEVPEGRLSRAQGDVHPEGNPHVMLDPLRAGEIALHIARRMGELYPEGKPSFDSNAAQIKSRLEEKTKTWQRRIEQSGVKKIVTYHKTLSYFFDRFKIENPIILEPKPGIPPTAKHILQVIDTIKKEDISLVLIENYFSDSVAQRIKKDSPSLRVALVPVAVEGDSSIKSLDDLYEKLVTTIEGK